MKVEYIADFRATHVNFHHRITSEISAEDLIRQCNDYFVSQMLPPFARWVLLHKQDGTLCYTCPPTGEARVTIRRYVRQTLLEELTPLRPIKNSKKT